LPALNEWQSILWSNPLSSFKGIAYMHQPLWYTLILKFVKPFMSKKLRDRIIFLGEDE
jgi:hypothetical protein